MTLTALREELEQMIHASEYSPGSRTLCSLLAFDLRDELLRKYTITPVDGVPRGRSTKAVLDQIELVSGRLARLDTRAVKRAEIVLGASLALALVAVFLFTTWFTIAIPSLLVVILGVVVGVHINRQSRWEQTVRLRQHLESLRNELAGGVQ